MMSDRLTRQVVQSLAAHVPYMFFQNILSLKIACRIILENIIKENDLH